MLVQVQIKVGLLQYLQILELFPFLVGGNLSEILIFGGVFWLVCGGLIFLFIAVVGNISGKLEPGQKERMVVGVAGTTLLVIGLISAAGVGLSWGDGGEPTEIVTPSPTSSPAEDGDGAGEHEITIVSWSPPSPATLDPGERVNVSFEYRTTEDDGVRIFVRPLTDGEVTSGYRGHPSPAYSEGTGEGFGWFYFDSEATVDQIRVQMWDEEQNELLHEITFPVSYRWTPTSSPAEDGDGAGEHEITVISRSPPSPATLAPGERVNVSFEYSTTEEDGVRIFVRPLTDGEVTSSYRAHGSPLYSEETGEGFGWFFFDSEATVDQIRIQMWDEEQNELLHEVSIPVNYRWTG